MNYNTNQPNTNQPQYEKNPNGGYLNPSKYGGHFGKLELTPELLAEAAKTGKIEVKITEEKLNSKGEPYIRITAKPFDDSWRQQPQQPQQPQQQQYQPQQAPAQYQPQQAPQAAPAPIQQPQAAPAAAPFEGDSIPF
jgi:hypothetical protein